MALLRHVLTVFCAAVLIAPAVAGEMRYGADIHQSAWTADSTRVHCSLTQTIPFYGKAVFEQRVGGNLQFYIEVQRKPHNAGMARLVSAAPAWKHGVLVRDLGQLDFTANNPAFRAGERTARRLLLELEQGMFPTLSYKDWSDGRDEVQVALSAVNLRSALGEFLGCLNQQLSYGFADVKNSTIGFGFDSSELNAAARKRLDRVADYLLADPTVMKVTLEGRTDNTGYRRYNLMLAKRRTAAVRDYLKRKGVDTSLITISTRGEHRPVASNRTAEGRALNRSVSVVLSK